MVSQNYVARYSQPDVFMKLFYSLNNVCYLGRFSLLCNCSQTTITCMYYRCLRYGIDIRISFHFLIAPATLVCHLFLGLLLSVHILEVDEVLVVLLLFLALQNGGRCHGGIINLDSAISKLGGKVLDLVIRFLESNGGICLSPESNPRTP